MWFYVGFRVGMNCFLVDFCLPISKTDRVAFIGCLQDHMRHTRMVTYHR